ncbi:hypothetical protein DQ04_09061030 [Trypanosoma grayi]|uniref:hypothetical protein n=1 Tax=Trypanosoma grayi TaxID=71804 RepID=UPI0004F47EE9|nr:hypothetical protein DQ04_09061030 [Trypanosoma grayi]KEG07696.1 hypothetical protein DQ04_09061030 [Trypanosoma grayi]
MGWPTLPAERVPHHPGTSAMNSGRMGLPKKRVKSGAAAMSYPNEEPITEARAGAGCTPFGHRADSIALHVGLRKLPEATPYRNTRLPRTPVFTDTFSPPTSLQTACLTNKPNFVSAVLSDIE